MDGHLHTVGASLASIPWIDGRTVESARKAGEFADLFATHAGFAWRVLRRLGVPDADTEDAVQEVFLVVHRKLATYEERGSVRAWIFAICRQVASHHRRTVMRRDRRESIPPPVTPADDPHEMAVRREAVAVVHEFLAQLDEDRAIVFFLADVEEMPVTEIASSLGVNLNTVYGRLRTARLQFEDFVTRRAARDR